MFSDEHLEAKGMGLFVYLTHGAECAAESPVTAQALLKWRLVFENTLTSYLTCADHKQAYKSWPELSQQTDIWVYLRLTVQRSQGWYLYGFRDLLTPHSSLLLLQNDWQLSWRKAEMDEIRRWFVRVKGGLNSDMVWPLGALRATPLFDVPHALCLPCWVGKTKPERAQCWFGATTLRRCYCSNFMGAF